MRVIIAAFFSLVLMFDLCFADEKQNLTEEKAKISYSVGYQVGGDFKRQGLDIKPEILLQGIQDAIAGVEPQMNQEEMRATLVALKKKITAAQRQQMKIKAAENLKTGKEFLAMNKEKEGVKTLASGLQYKVITEGTGALPMATDSVTVNYRGTLIDGTEFDSSYSRNRPATFRLDQVIPGWTETLQLMKEGAKWQLFIPPELAYAERGAGSHIGPNSTLIFDVELISVNRAE